MSGRDDEALIPLHLCPHTECGTCATDVKSDVTQGRPRVE